MRNAWYKKTQLILLEIFKESAGIDGFRLNKNNCSKFYQCASGKWIEKNCSASLAFSPPLGLM